MYSFSVSLLTEPLFIPLLALSSWAFVTNDTGSAWQSVLAGVLAGVGCLVRPTLQFFPLYLLALSCILFLLAPCKGKRDLFRALYFSIGSFGIVAPYVAKNYVVFHAPRIANGTGAVLYRSTDLRKEGNEPVYAGMDYDTSEITAPYQHLDTEGDELLTQQATRVIARFPRDIAELTLVKAFRFLYGSPQYYFYPFADLATYWRQVQEAHYLASHTLELILTAFIVTLGVGVLLFGVLPPTLRPWSLALSSYFVAVHALTFPVPRLLLPIYPLLCVTAAAVIFGTLSRSRRAALIAVSALAFLGTSFYAKVDTPWIVSQRYTEYFETRRSLPGRDAADPNDVELSSEEIVVRGDDPWLSFYFDAYIVEKNAVVFVKLRALRAPVGGWPAPSTLQLYWSSGKQEPFLEARSLAWPSESSDGAQIYRFVFPQSVRGSSIGALRVDLPQNAIGASFQVDQVSVVR